MSIKGEMVHRLCSLTYKWNQYVNLMELKLKVFVDPMFVFTYNCKGIVDRSKDGYLSRKCLDNNKNSLGRSGNVAIMKVCEKKPVAANS